MNSRERVRKAIRFEEPDRVPIDVGGSLVTGICIDEYVDLVKHLGLDLGLPIVYEQFGMLARLAEPVRRRLHCDVIELENPSVAWGLENKDWKPWKTGVGNTVLMPGGFNPVTDEKGYLYINDPQGKTLAYMPKNGLYFERYCVTTLSNSDDKMSPEAWAKSIPLLSDEHLRQLEENARQLYENTEYSIQGGFVLAGLGSNGIFAGHTISDWLCRLVTEPDYAFSILQATAQRAVENLTGYLQAVGKYIDTIFMSGTDFGTQKGELFSPQIFKELYVPNIKLMTDYVHRAQRREDDVSQLRHEHEHHGALHRGGRRYSQPHPNDRGEHGPGGTQETLRRANRLLGRRRGNANRPPAWNDGRRARTSARSASAFSPPAAGSCSRRFTTSSTAFRPKTC